MVCYLHSKASVKQNQGLYVDRTRLVDFWSMYRWTPSCLCCPSSRSTPAGLRISAWEELQRLSVTPDTREKRRKGDIYTLVRGEVT